MFLAAGPAFCTTVSYIPQLRKCWKTGETGDLSLKMLLLLACGLSLWLVYGVMRSDPVIMLAGEFSQPGRAGRHYLLQAQEA